MLTARSSQESQVKYCTNHEGVDFSNAERITIEDFFNDAVFDNPRQLRIDAITNPTIPREATSELVSLFIPGVGNPNVYLGTDTPATMLEAISKSWHEAVRNLRPDEDREELTELRLDFGQDKYVPSASNTALSGIEHDMEHTMPLDSQGYRRHALQTDDFSRDYADDILWMRRAIQELIPVQFYHRIIFGDEHAARNDTRPGRFEESILAPLDLSMHSALNLFAAQMTALGEAIRQSDTLSSPLCYFMNYGTPHIIAGSQWYGCPSRSFVVLPAGLPDGLNSLRLQLVSLADGAGYWQNPQHSGHIYNNTTLKQLLTGTHNTDAIADLVRDAWEYNNSL